MTPRGVCRIIMVAIILIGSGLGPMFYVTNVRAIAPAVPAATTQQAVLPSTDLGSVAAQVGGVISCTNDAFSTPDGLAGRVVDGTSPGTGLKNVTVTLVTQDAQGNEVPVAIPGNPTTTSGNPLPSNQWGYWDFGNINNVPAISLTNISVKFEKAGYLTEYFDRRYDITSSTKLTVTNAASGPGGTCLVSDEFGRSRFNSHAQILLNTLGGIAGRMTVAIPPDSLVTHGSPTPLTDESIPITASGGTIYVYTDTRPSPIPATTPYSTTVDGLSDGYYRVGNIPPGQYVVKFVAPGYVPSAGTWWRDGGFDFFPYTLHETPPNDAYYYTRTITVPTMSSSTVNQYITQVVPIGDDDGSYVLPDGSLVRGINGHLAQQAYIVGKVVDSNSTPVPGATVELFLETSNGSTKLSGVLADASGNYSFVNLNPGITYTLKATPPTGVPLVSRWYQSTDFTNRNLLKIDPGTGGVVSATANITLVQGAKFAGQISDFDTPATKLPGIKVQVFRATDDPLTAMPIDTSPVSDANGNYTTTALLEPGTGYKLAFVPDPSIDNLHASGFCGDPFSANECASPATASLATSHVFTPTAGGQTIPANIKLVAGSRITGAITSPVGWTTAGLQVQVYVYGSSGQIYQTFQVAPSSGDPTVINYSTGGLYTDTYKIKFVPLPSQSNTGFIPVYYSSSSSTGVTDVNQATTTNVNGRGNVYPNENVTLREGGQINLHVQLIDPANQGQTITMANTLVEIYGGASLTTLGTQLSTGTTDQNGNITFSALDTTAPGAGNPFAIRIVPNPSTKLIPAWVTVTAGANKDVFNLVTNSGIRQPLWLTQTLYKGQSIGGRIYDPNVPGYNFGSTSISLYDSSKNIIGTISNLNAAGTVFTQTSNTDWHYKIIVPPGTYYLGFTPPDTSPNPNPYTTFFYQNAALLSDPPALLKSVTVGVSDNFTNTDAVFTPKGKIKFFIIDNNNVIQNGASVVVYDQNKQVYLNGTADNSGVYTTPIINAGPSAVYYASASNGGALGYYNGHLGPWNPANADPITIPVGVNGAITPTIIITLQTKIVATGTVNIHPSSGANQPLPGAKVYALNSADNSVLDGPVTTDANGRYSLVGIPFNSNYYLKYSWQDPTGNVPNVVYYDGSTYGNKNPGTAITYTTNALNKNLTFNQGASLNGVVYKKSGAGTNPMPGALVSVLDPVTQASVWATTTTTSNGSYLIPNLPPGTYKIQFVGDASTGFATVYYIVNQAYGTGLYSQGTSVSLNDLSPQTINQTFDVSGQLPISSCSINGALPVSATLNSVAINFNGNCSGTGKIYVSMQSPVITSQAPFVFSDNVNTLNHTIVATSGSFPPDTNLYVKVAIISGTQEYSNYPEIVVRTAAAGDKWYFPYGDSRTSGSSVNSEFLHIFNYNTSTSALVTVSYIISGGSPVVRNNISIAPGKRLDIEVTNPADGNSLNAAVSGGAVHATTVIGSIPIMVERSVYNYSSNVNVTGGKTWGGSAVPGSTALSNDWYFADGTSSDLSLGNPNYNTYFTILNPSPSMTVCIFPAVYADSSTSGVATAFSFTRIDIGPNQFKTVSMAAIFNGIPALQQTNFRAGFATRFTGVGSGCNTGASTASAPFVVEQTTQFASPQADGSLRKGESNLIGSLSAGLQWYFMEGLNDKIVSRTYNLLNPNAQNATVTFSVQLDNPPAGAANPVIANGCATSSPAGANPIIVQCTVPASKRLNVQVNDVNVPLVGRTFGFSVNIVSDQPIVAQRTMKFTWRQIPIIDGLFAQVPINRVANTWLFAAGSTTNDVTTGKLADMALNVYNSNNSTVRLKITYYTATTGSSTTASSVFYLSLNGLSRTTIRPSARTSPDYPSVGPNQTLVAVKIESVDINDNLSLPVLAERVMFWNWPGGAGIGNINMGNASFGYIPPGS